MKRLVYAILFSLALFLLVAPLYAFTHVSGDSVIINTEIEDDVYALGNSIRLLANLPQDFVAAGNNIKVSGDVGDNLIAAGGMVNISGNVGNVARVAGAIVTIESETANDLIVAGGSVNIERDAMIGADLVVTGGKVEINGDVGGRILATGGTIDINGKVAGDVIIDRVGKLNIGPSAFLEGNLNYSSSQPASVHEQAQIAGEIDFTFLEEPLREVRITPADPLALFTATFVGAKIVSLISLFVLGLLLMLFIPKAFDRFNSRMNSTMGNCAGAGAIALFGTPLAALTLFVISVFLFITVIGSGTGLMLVASNIILIIFYLALIYASILFLSYFIGRKILSRTSLNFNRYGWKVVAYLIGLVILSVAFAIPFIGWLARTAAIIFGLGGLVLILKDWFISASRIQ